MMQIRHAVYRDRQGFLICGKDSISRDIRIFTETRASAERIRTKVKAGEQIVLADFQIPTEKRCSN